MTEKSEERIYHEAKKRIDMRKNGIHPSDYFEGWVVDYIDSSTTDKLSVEKLQEELDSCIQTLISVSILANGDENIVIGNFVDSRLSKLAKTHENVTKYIERVTGKNIDVVLAENAALEALEGEEND
ncbi:hypothetical protein [Lactococcus lactis]|uniref:hypothetical protein n=1 Tax=Lactococcus lactis TaxID=1358 RepID=UPI0037CB823D